MNPHRRSDRLRRRLPALISAQAHRCGLCAKPLPSDLAAIHIDHIVPLSQGGHSRLSNLQATHAACNLRKGNRKLLPPVLDSRWPRRRSRSCHTPTALPGKQPSSGDLRAARHERHRTEIKSIIAAPPEPHSASVSTVNKNALVPARDTQHPAILEAAGPNATFAADEFFTARIRNPHTRKAYGRAIREFLSWAEAQGLALHEISPAYAGQFIDGYGRAIPSQKLALAALRQFFDALVTRHAVVLNPFSTVRGPRSDSRDGKTPEITVPQVRQLLASIDCSRPIGLRNRAIIGTLAYTGARVGAISALRIRDLRDYGDHRAFLFLEKGGRHREIPVRLDLDTWLLAYLQATDAAADPPDAPLYRAATHFGDGQLTPRALPPWSIRDMLKRQLRTAGLPPILRPHSFRVMVINDLLAQNVPMEDVQYLAGHVHPSTTQIYDRRARHVSRNTVERISV